MIAILCVETSGACGSVCIVVENQVEVFAESREKFTHAKTLTVLIEDSMKRSGITIRDLSAVAVSRGPGSFTGLRVGTSVAKGICYTLDIPLLSVCSLRALANEAMLSGNSADIYISMIDARRDEVYAAVYNDNLHELAGPHSVILNAKSFSKYFDGRRIFITGNAAEKAERLIGNRNLVYKRTEPSARHLGFFVTELYQNQEFENLAYYSPFYLKPPNITSSKKKLI